MSFSYGFYFSQPWWLLGCVLLAPVVILGRRYLAALEPARRRLAMVLRILLVSVLVVLLARPMIVRKSRRVTVVAVVDRSQSIPIELQEQALDWLAAVAASKADGDQIAVVDIAESAAISKLPSTDNQLRRRNTTLTGQQSKLADGIEMAMAIAPPDTATRVLLISEGNETEGDLRQAARAAAANRIPVDVLPVYYHHTSEVIFRKLSSPPRAESGQTISLRFVMDSTSEIAGRLLLSVNGRNIDLSPDSDEVGAEVSLVPGTNVKTISVPVGTRGLHEFEAVFIPNSDAQDKIVENNRATAITYVAGPGHVLVVDTDGATAGPLAGALGATDLDVRHIVAPSLGEDLARLMDTDAVVLVDTDAGSLTYRQHDMLVRYVNDLGGGLIMVGGPHSFGAGGWIGSPVASILPVDPDPPQQRKLPKGALVLIMHSSEMPQGNFWGKEVAAAAVRTLSALDLLGILAYDWRGMDDWVHPFSPVGDRTAALSAIQQMQMGDMPDFGVHLQKAYDVLTASDATQRHVIVISDGDPEAPTPQLVDQIKQAGITVTGVAVFPHPQVGAQRLVDVAKATGGSFHDVTDPTRLPQIFIKEAQKVRRSLILEESFTPAIEYGLSELTKGLSGPLPGLDGYVLTGDKGGLSQKIMTSHKGDPVLAACQSGLGRCVAFTSATDSRWAARWIAWPGFGRFWEQTVRWVGKSARGTDCEMFSDVQGRRVTVNIETIESQGRRVEFAGIDAEVLEPDLSGRKMALTQTGPGQYTGRFRADESGSYVVNVRYTKIGAGQTVRVAQHIVSVPFAPEFRDLSDNAPLLEEISQSTGGRVLAADPNQARAFSRAGLKYPAAHLPMTRPLLLTWVVVLLLDVAVRRVAVDLRGIVRRLRAWAAPSLGRKQDRTISRLQQTRDQLRKRWERRKDIDLASQRFEAADKTIEMPPTDQAPESKEPEPEPEPETRKSTIDKIEVDEAPSHIDRLLRAKKKAAGGDSKSSG